MVNEEKDEKTIIEQKGEGKEVFPEMERGGKTLEETLAEGQEVVKANEFKVDEEIKHMGETTKTQELNPIEEKKVVAVEKSLNNGVKSAKNIYEEDVEKFQKGKVSAEEEKIQLKLVELKPKVDNFKEKVLKLMKEEYLSSDDVNKSEEEIFKLYAEYDTFRNNKVGGSTADDEARKYFSDIFEELGNAKKQRFLDNYKRKVDQAGNDEDFSALLSRFSELTKEKDLSNSEHNSLNEYINIAWENKRASEAEKKNKESIKRIKEKKPYLINRIGSMKVAIAKEDKEKTGRNMAVFEKELQKLETELNKEIELDQNPEKRERAAAIEYINKHNIYIIERPDKLKAQIKKRKDEGENATMFEKKLEEANDILEKEIKRVLLTRKYKEYEK